jgi:hypothetical protein
MSSPSHLDIRLAEEDEVARQAYEEEEAICWSTGPILLNNQPIMGSALGNHPDKASAAVRALVKDSTSTTMIPKTMHPLLQTVRISRQDR